MAFEFTKNYKFTVLNNENVWAKAMSRVVERRLDAGKGDRRDDRAHQAGRGLTRALPGCSLPCAGSAGVRGRAGS